MDRRAFLKGTGLATAAWIAGAVVAAGGPATRALARPRHEVAVGSLRYRIDGGPQVFVSRDGGATWTSHANLGDRYSIRTLRADGRGRVRLTVHFDRRQFYLELARDKAAWLVA